MNGPAALIAARRAGTLAEVLAAAERPGASVIDVAS